MNEEYVKYILEQILLDCHQSQRDEAIKWVIEHMELKKEKPYGRDSI